MAKLNEHMQMISSAILSQAESESKEIIRRATELRETELAECENAIISDMFGKLQRQSAQLRQESVKNIAKAQIQAHRSLLLRREELTASVFESVRARLLEYAGTRDYQTRLIGELEALKNEYDHASSTVSLREADLPLAPRIKETLPGCAVVSDPAIKLGGFKLLNSGARVLVDNTLDAKLESQRPWFLRHCGMKAVT